MVKKGSISLSINMVVVVVLAFVMLGLMLTLGRNIVESAGRTTDEITEQTRQDILNQLTRSNEPLYFNQREFDVSFGQQRTISFGVKNTGVIADNFRIEIFDVTDGNPTQIDSSQSPTNTQGSFFWATIPDSYTAGQGKVFDVQYRTPRQSRGTFIYQFRLIRGTETESEAEQLVFINVI